jgi:cephalosporin hydroxylase
MFQQFRSPSGGAVEYAVRVVSTWPRRIAEKAVVTAVARRVNAYVSTYPTIEEAVSFAYAFRFAGIGIPPNQIRSEITTLLELIVQDRPRRILEIGTSAGGTLFLLATVASDDARIMSIDLPQAQGGYNPQKAPLYRRFAREGQRIDLLLGDSHEPGTVDATRGWLGGQELDLLFIDGDHSYEGVATDMQLYSRLVAAGGLVVFHDIVPGPAEGVGGVPNFWQEVRIESDATEIVESWAQRGFGLGVIRQRAAHGRPLGPPTT